MPFSTVMRRPHCYTTLHIGRHPFSILRERRIHFMEYHVMVARTADCRSHRTDGNCQDSLWPLHFPRLLIVCGPFFLYYDDNFLCRQLTAPHTFAEAAWRKPHQPKIRSDLTRDVTHTLSHSSISSKHKWLIDLRGPEGKGKKQKPMVGPRNSRSLLSSGIRGTYINMVSLFGSCHLINPSRCHSSVSTQGRLLYGRTANAFSSWPS